MGLSSMSASPYLGSEEKVLSNSVSQREIVSLHIGQCGVQIGNACWELYGIEHGITPSGFIWDESKTCPSFNNDSISSFYHETHKHKYVPRSVLIDFDPTVIDEITNGPYRDLFRRDGLVKGKEDAANVYSRGFYTIGKELENQALESIRKEIEVCQNPSGFFLFHSMGGGTGSGFTSLLVHRLNEEFPKINKLEFVIYPCPRLSTSVLEPYNAVLMTHSTMEATDCSFMMDNEALYDICFDQLDLHEPVYPDLNRIVAQITSAITAPMRFDGPINVDLSEFQTNLVPYPRIHYPIVSYAPFDSPVKAAHKRESIKVLTGNAFRRSNQLLKCDPSRGKYMACCMLYRGRIPLYDVNASIRMIKNTKLGFVDWCPTGFKIGLNFQPPSIVPGYALAGADAAICAITNNTSIVEVWSRVNYKFDLLYAKRAFAHWFLGEGMDEQEFTDARENLAALEKDYDECAKQLSTDEEEETTTPSTRRTSTTNRSN